MGIRNILVPVDFSKDGEIALDYACTLGRQFNAVIHLVHVLNANSDNGEMRKANEQLLSALKPSQENALVIRREVLRGSIAGQLGEYAHDNDIDFLVMGTRGRNGFSSQPIGKHVEQVISNVPRPVMLIRTDLSPDRPRLSEIDEKYERVRVVNIPAIDLIARASSLRATDIHIDPLSSDEYEVRLRIDGQLTQYCVMDAGVAEHLIQQLLVLARLDQGSPFTAREGRLFLPEGINNLEVRITSSPVADGNAISLRLFATDRMDLSIDQLGLSEYARTAVNNMLSDANGLILVTGPTGSGKTTTVYSMLAAFRKRNFNIVSIEDPVEFSVPFVRQMSVDEKHGVTMTSGLKTILRMDPDIVAIGEIRDSEAAAIALSAANAGRLVISSLHTRDAAATITALRDLSVDDRSLTGNLTGVINQRLVRRLCQHCRKSRELTAHEAEYFVRHHLAAPERVFERVGCEHCLKTGYYGRCGIFEAVLYTEGLLEAIAAHQSEEVLRRELRSTGVPSLTNDALQKVRDGITTFEEIQSISWL